MKRPDFTRQAACRPGFTELPERDQKATCATCPVRLRCALFGLTDPAATSVNPTMRGGHALVYGGLNLDELHRLADEIARDDAEAAAL